MRIRVNGIHLNVEVAGEGQNVASPVLLLLHGFTGSHLTWDPFIKTWGRSYRLVMVDIIGHGQSDAPSDPNRYSMDHAVNDVIGILDALDIDRCHVVGYSMGGRLALAMAIRFPERVQTLVLEGSSSGTKRLITRSC